jgi:Tol biopolymer transport system component
VVLAASSAAFAPAAGGPLLAASARADRSEAVAPVARSAGAGPLAAVRPPAPVVPLVEAAPGQPSGKTAFVSEAAGGGPTNGRSQDPSISAGGRWIAFASAATNLVAGGSPGTAGDSSVPIAIFLADRSTGTTVELPLPDNQLVPAGGVATTPSISSDGTVVAFMYQTPKSGAALGVSIMVWDRATGRTQRISRPKDPAVVDRSREPAVSGDGRYVAFTSDDPSLVTGDNNGAQDVFRFDRQTGTTDLVSAGVSGAASGYSPSISGDGSLVAFVSDNGSAFFPGFDGIGSQVFLRDMNAQTTQLVSVGVNGSPPNDASTQPSISDNGQFVAFTSVAPNLVDGVSPAVAQVYRRDMVAGQTVLVSAKSDGSPAASRCYQPGISRDGRMVAYVQAGGVTAAISNQRLASTILLRDITAGATALITVNLSGKPSDSGSAEPHVAGGGRYVVFASIGTDLVAGDTNQAVDVFLRDMPPKPSLKPSTVDFGSRAVGVTPSYLATVVTNSGWGPMTPKPATIGGKNAGDFAVLTDGCQGLTLFRGDSCTITAAFAPLKPGARAATLQISSNAPGSPLTGTLRGAGSQSQIVLDPPVGPQGIVVVATGSGFPPGAKIQLTWSTGITPTLPVVTAKGSAGTWSLQVLVFHHDITGPRNLIATWVGGPAGSEFPTMQVPMLVTVRSMTPPDVLGGGSGPITLLFRG